MVHTRIAISHSGPQVTYVPSAPLDYEHGKNRVPCALRRCDFLLNLRKIRARV